MSCGFPVSAVLGRGDKIVLLEELRDELLSALPIVGALRLVHQFLHDLRKFVVTCSSFPLLQPDCGGVDELPTPRVEKVGLSRQVLPFLLTSFVAMFSVVRTFVYIIRAEGFRCGHCLSLLQRWENFPILEPHRGQNLHLALGAAIAGRRDGICTDYLLVGHDVLRCVKLFSGLPSLSVEDWDGILVQFFILTSCRLFNLLLHAINTVSDDWLSLKAHFKSIHYLNK